MISVDTKNKELIGDFKNAGRTWTKEPIEVNAHDFPQDALCKAAPYGASEDADELIRPKVFIRGTKADTPHWVPLPVAAVAAIRKLREQPLIDRRVFPVRETTAANAGSWISNKVAAMCVEAGLVETVERDGKPIVQNKWRLTDVRRRMNTDLGMLGATKKEQVAVTGHRSEDVNTKHYECVVSGRLRELTDKLPAFGLTG